MRKLVMQPGEQILDVIPQEFTVDNEQGIKDPIGMSGVRLKANFHIITCQTARRRHLQVHQKGRPRSGWLILEPLASAASVLSDEEKEAGVALVDIGGGTTDIAIFQDGIIRHTAVIPFGGNVISDDIIKDAVMKKQAEQLKKFGSALSQETKSNEIVCIPGLTGRKPKRLPKTLAQIIEARMTEIIEHVHYEIRAPGLATNSSAALCSPGAVPN